MSQTSTASFDILMNLVVCLIAPIFLGVTGGDVTLARMAARETIHDYQARNRADLLAVAQIVGFGLAALGSVSLSMADDLPLPMMIRLQSNGIACNRAAEQNRKARRVHQAEPPRPAPPPEPETREYDPPPQPAAFLSPEAEQLLATEARTRLENPIETSVAPAPTTAASRTPAEKRNQEMWGIAYASESSEIAASLPTLPPAERQAAAMRAGLLGSAAHDLICGVPEPPIQPATLARLTQPAAPPKPPPR